MAVRELEKAAMSWAVLCALLAGAAIAAPESPAGEALASAERAFARTAAEKGVKEAFLAYLAEDSVLFRPGAVPGKAWTRDNPPPPIRLSWSPSFVQVSAAGDLGYTTGPYEVRSADPKRQDTGAETGYGQFVTVWRRQPDGAWRVALDIGVPTPQPPTEAGAAVRYGRSLVAVPPAGPPETAEKAERERLLAADRALAAAVAAQGAVPAYAPRLGDGARLLRQGSPPAIGAEAIRTALASLRGKLSWLASAGAVSRSGDLGYTYGGATFQRVAGGPERSFNVLHVWERAPGGDWKLVLDLLGPVPPAPPATPSTG